LAGEVLYKSGDLARWLPDGNIEFAGRSDRQVKIRGMRIELGEIENQLLKNEKIKEALVVAKEEENGDRYPCAYIVSDRTLAIPELRTDLSVELPGYMIPSYFVRLEKIPLTANGKIDRKSLPEPEVRGPGTYVGPRNEIEKKLAEIWSNVLGIEKNVIGPDDNFFQLGGHSLRAMTMTAKIHKEFHVNISLSEVFKTPGLRGLSEYIKRATKEEYVSIIKSVEKKEYYILSSAQKRLYFIQQMVGRNPVYNMPTVVTMEGNLDKTRLEDAFKRLIMRYESLRTSFEILEDEPVQRIHGNIEFEIEYAEAGGESTSSIEEIIRDFIKPFQLSEAPLLRVGLINTKGKRNTPILIVDMHHIISDGVSQGILIKDFMLLYGGETLPALNLRYKDYSEWQNSERKHENFYEQKAFWLRNFSGENPVLELATDYPRPAVQNFEGDALSFEIERRETRELKKLVLTEEKTMFMVLLSIYNVFLSKLSNQEDIVVGTPTTGRRHADLEKIIGMFVNTLPMRNFPGGDHTFKQFLIEVKDRTLEVFAHQDYQYDDLVEELPVSRDTSRNPLFDTMFALQNMEPLNIEIPGLKLKHHEYKNRISRFDLTLLAYETKENLFFTFEYCAKLFKEQTIKRFIRYFKKAVSSIIEGPNRKISEIEIITREEKQQILFDFNDSGGYPIEKTLHGLFEVQVEQTPDITAVVHANHYLSYHALDQRAKMLARILRTKGAAPGIIAGIMVERSPEMIIGILGILKARGAYLPVNIKQPSNRKEYMLGDSGAKLLLTHRGFGEELKGTCEVINLDDENVYRYKTEMNRREKGTGTWNDFAYVIYTSGSTGNPKGVPITHANISPLLHWGYHTLKLNSTERCVQNVSYFFDWSVWEIFITITTGAGLYVADAEVILNPGESIDFFKKNDITVLHITPTQFQYFLGFEGDLRTLRYLFIGAERLTDSLVQRSYEVVKEDCRVFNMYGPTEATIISSVLELKRTNHERYKGLSSVPIGKPVSNMKLLVLDKNRNICPPGVPGELYIVGDGVAYGYLNDSEKTSLAFIKNLFPTEEIKGDYLYKTGDRVRWLWSGDVEFLGRIDQQIKIRGYRIELGEIESQLLKHDDIKEAVVISKQDDTEDKYLCAYIVPHIISALDFSELKTFLSMRLPGYMIPSYFVQIEEIPLTPNGKINRKILPEPVIEKSDKYAAPRNELEEKLVRIWSEVLLIDMDKIHIDSDFFQLRGHSIKAMTLVSKIHKKLKVKISLEEVFKFYTIRDMDLIILKNRKTELYNKYINIRQIEEKDFYEVTYNQKRLWNLKQSNPQDISYNMPQRITLNFKINKKIIKRVFSKIIEKNENFRTYFIELEGRPVQKIAKSVTLPFQIIDISSMEEGKKQQEKERIYTKEARTVFDLSTPPIFKSILVRLAPEEYELIFNMYHIIADAWSFEILKKDFLNFFEKLQTNQEIKPEPLKLQYKDFAAWQNQQISNHTYSQAAHQYWLKKVKSGLPTLPLPFDFPGQTQAANDSGSLYRSVIESDVTNKLRELLTEHHVSLFILLFSVFNLLLTHISGEKEIVCRLVTAGRYHVSLNSVVGGFVCPIIIKNHVDKNGKKNFIDFLKRINKNILEALEYQWYPIEKVLEELGLKYPDLIVCFNMVNIDNDASKRALKNFDSFHREKVIDEKFPLYIQIIEYSNGIEIFWRYIKRYFKPGTIEGFAALFKRFMKEIL
jgi:amino acid adenylation domain-containing protein